MPENKSNLKDSRKTAKQEIPVDNIVSMDINRALDIKKALVVLADTLETKPEDIAGCLMLFNSKTEHRLIEASDLWNKFDKKIKESKLLKHQV